jgi:Bor protein
MLEARLAALAVTLAVGSGCFKATFDDRTLTPAVRHVEWRHRFIAGLVGDGEVDARTFCPDARFAQIRTGGSVVTSLVAIFTLFIYTPREVFVTCAAPEVTR